MNVAKEIILKIGHGGFRTGVELVAKILGVHSSRVYRFTYPVERGGTGGLVPARHQQTLLDWARLNGVDLTPDDFFKSETTALPKQSDQHRQL